MWNRAGDLKGNGDQLSATAHACGRARTHTHAHTHTPKWMCTHAGACKSVRGDLLAFSLEEIRIARAHSDPRGDHHQDPQRTGNKSDPSSALSSFFFCPQLLPPSFSLPFTSFTLLWLPYIAHCLCLKFLQIIHLWSHLVLYEVLPGLYRTFSPVCVFVFGFPAVLVTNGNILWRKD